MTQTGVDKTRHVKGADKRDYYGMVRTGKNIQLNPFKLDIDRDIDRDIALHQTSHLQPLSSRSDPLLTSQETVTFYYAILPFSFMMLSSTTRTCRVFLCIRT